MVHAGREPTFAEVTDDTGCGGRDIAGVAGGVEECHVYVTSSHYDGAVSSVARITVTGVYGGHVEVTGKGECVSEVVSVVAEVTAAGGVEDAEFCTAHGT